MNVFLRQDYLKILLSQQISNLNIEQQQSESRQINKNSKKTTKQNKQQSKRTIRKQKTTNNLESSLQNNNPMQLTIQNYKKFQSQSHTLNYPISQQDLTQEINRLQQLKLQNTRGSVSALDKKQIDRYIRIYKVAIREIEKMKAKLTTPGQFNQKLADIFDNETEQILFDQVMEKTSEIRSSQIEIPTFKKASVRENVIQQFTEKNDLASPALRHFFEKKQAQLNHTKTNSNFKLVLQAQEANNKSSRSVSQSRSSGASSFMKKPSKQVQLKKVLEQNRKIKEEYEKKLKRELELSEFEKNLLKDEKNRYMMKIEELQNELENLYRANYKLKEEVQVKEKTLREKEFESEATFRNVDENVYGGQGQDKHGKDYYQPYVMTTKHNDLKKLNMKCQTQYDVHSQHNKSDQYFFNTQNNNLPSPVKPEPVIDILGNELEKQLQQIEKEKSRSNQSRRSEKKWSRQYNPNKFIENNNHANEDLLSVLRKDDSEDQIKIKQIKGNNSNRFDGHDGRIESGPFQMGAKNPFVKKQQNSYYSQHSFHKNLKPQHDHPPINILPPTLSKLPPDEPIFTSTTSLQIREPSQIPYQPSSNYSFTKAINKDYSMSSNPANYDTFDMTRTYLNISQNEESETNKYIDSRTSTRNKVAFFKDSLILIKNDTFELAFKRSALVNTKDRVRMIFFVKNKTSQALTITFRYQYDTSYFKLKVNQKLQTISPFSQSRQDLEIYAYSSIDLNQVIDIMVHVNNQKFGLWMPVLWIQSQQIQNFKLPNKNEEITILPDRQFRNFDTAKTVIPLMFGGKDGNSEWAYFYGVCKFGPCYVKLIWEGSELKIQTDQKWIDLLAFVMHHVK